MVFPIGLNSQGEKLLMARQRLDFSHFGITEDSNAVIDRLVTHFNTHTRGIISIDELLLHPTDAIQFCNHVRAIEGWFGLPDDMVLRPILTRRKNPT
jgi:hypothetical protein